MGECQEDQGCQEAGTATRDVFVSTCPATWGPEALGCPRCHQRDLDQDIQALDQGIQALDLGQDQDIQALDQEALDLAMEQLGTAPVVLPRGRQGLLEVERSRSTSGHGRLVWSGPAAPLSSVEQQSSAMSGF